MHRTYKYRGVEFAVEYDRAKDYLRVEHSGVSGAYASEPDASIGLLYTLPIAAPRRMLRRLCREATERAQRAVDRHNALATMAGFIEALPHG